LEGDVAKDPASSNGLAVPTVLILNFLPTLCQLKPRAADALADGGELHIRGPWTWRIEKPSTVLLAVAAAGLAALLSWPAAADPIAGVLDEVRFGVLKQVWRVFVPQVDNHPRSEGAEESTELIAGLSAN
jgi:hypothetical protein